MFSTFIPARYAKYDGMSGNMHGEKIERIPAIKTSLRVRFMELLYLFCAFFSMNGRRGERG